MKAMLKMDELLSRYIMDTNIKASILMRSERESSDRDIPFYGDEEEYFKNIYFRTFRGFKSTDKRLVFS